MVSYVPRVSRLGILKLILSFSSRRGRSLGKDNRGGRGKVVSFSTAWPSCLYIYKASVKNRGLGQAVTAAKAAELRTRTE